MADPSRTHPGAPAATRPVDGAAADAARAGSIQTALSLVLAPLADALDDAENPLSPAQHERIALARRSATALLALVEGVLDGATPRSGFEASYVPTDLSAATRELAAMFRGAAAVADVDILFESSPLREPVQLDRGMWAAVPTATSGRREATVVRDFADVPRDAERVIFFPPAAGG